jgi:indole-3-glycerol phosphate synthase
VTARDGASRPSWPSRRFSQAIAEGDGISVIPILRGPMLDLAGAAEGAGAEALAVDAVEDVAGVRSATTLPLLVRRVPASPEALRRARDAGADACVLVFETLQGQDELVDELVATASELGLDCAIDVRDEGELGEVLERHDPEILVLSERERDPEEVELEITLDLLRDVPAGKLVISEANVTTRAQILELERAGVDAVLVTGFPETGFEARLAELTGKV